MITKFSELSKMTVAELHKQLVEGRAHLMNLRAQAKSQSLKNVREVRALKKHLARVMLALHQTQQKLVESSE